MRIVLALLTWLLLGAGCNQEVRPGSEPAVEPTDPVELARWLGGEWGFTLEGRELVWWRRPRELQLANPETENWFTGELKWAPGSDELARTMAAGGMIFMGYPIGVPIRATTCQEMPAFCEMGVGQAWVKEGFDKMPFLTPLSDDTPYIMSQPSGKIEAEQYVRMRGQWYRFVARAEARLNPERTRIQEVRVFPTEAYRLAALPEIDYVGTRPPVNLSAICSSLKTRADDRWDLRVAAPHLNYQYLNAVQVVWYWNRRYHPQSSNYDPQDDTRRYYHGHLGWTTAVFEENIHGDPPPDNYYDIFVRLVSKDPRSAHAYGRWWRVYNKRPITVKLINPQTGEWRCTNMDAENIFHWQGPFTLQELIARYGIDPANPPENLPEIPR